MTTVVILIWGKLIFDFFSYQKTAEQIYIPNINAKEMIVEDQFQFDYVVSPTYKDPFLGKQKAKIKQPIKSTKNPKKTTPPQPKKNTLNWPKITYKGLLNNRSQQHGIGIFEINGKETLLRLGEEKYQLELTYLTKDSVEFSYKEELKMIRK